MHHGSVQWFKRIWNRKLERSYHIFLNSNSTKVCEPRQPSCIVQAQQKAAHVVRYFFSFLEKNPSDLPQLLSLSDLPPSTRKLDVYSL